MSTSDAAKASAAKGNLKKLSHALSWALRHAAPKLKLTMTSDGFCPVDEILALRNKHPKFKFVYTLNDIRHVVNTNDKQRFKLAEFPGERYGRPTERSIVCIRANQGHSVPNIDPNELLTLIAPNELKCMPFIVHGTYQQPWQEAIQHQGLSIMGRHHIHCAAGMPGTDGVVSGMRKSCDVFIYIDTQLCASDGVLFYKSGNGVLLTPGKNGILPPGYFSHVTTKDGGVLLDNRGKE